MTLVTWREEYRVGVPMIDREHQYLFGLINEFHEQYACGHAKQRLLAVLSRLVAYAEEHFQHEEALMREIGYPRLSRQHGEHEKLYFSIFLLNEKLARNVISVDAETLRFLKHWMVDHILKEDLEIGLYLRRRTAEAERAAREPRQEKNGPPDPVSGAGPVAEPSAARS